MAINCPQATSRRTLYLIFWRSGCFGCRLSLICIFAISNHEKDNIYTMKWLIINHLRLTLNPHHWISQSQLSALVLFVIALSFCRCRAWSVRTGASWPDSREAPSSCTPSPAPWRRRCSLWSKWGEIQRYQKQEVIMMGWLIPVRDDCVASALQWRRPQIPQTSAWFCNKLSQIGAQRSALCSRGGCKL